MALWQNKTHYQPTPDSVRPVVPRKRSQSRQPRLPEWMRDLDNLCYPNRYHQLPIRMVCISESLTDSGRPMAVYACPSCNRREGWVVDRQTGRPFRLWAGKN